MMKTFVTSQHYTLLQPLRLGASIGPVSRKQGDSSLGESMIFETFGALTHFATFWRTINLAVAHRELEVILTIDVMVSLKT